MTGGISASRMFWSFFHIEVCAYITDMFGEDLKFGLASSSLSPEIREAEAHLQALHHPPTYPVTTDLESDESSEPQGARCSCMVRASAHGAMGRRIHPSWWTSS